MLSQFGVQIDPADFAGTALGYFLLAALVVALAITAAGLADAKIPHDVTKTGRHVARGR